ncbi:hypothetical protein QBC34DRAFT_498729 [Podospora aff. communis PSN243]|uniref:Uncharacterized protein n=1 Tax=Podospora aff. communis PSN243 TaxID=3040156 RepID=A0AAV9G9I9_9PEZI|nr:hypothetical protein QBC34DRAFT_498729 [Podospora aff. communis PSN243]
MPALTTADIAFLLCTSQQQKASQRFHLTLTTAYGLVLRLGANGSLTADLSVPDSSDSDLTPTTPTARSKLPFPSSKPAPTSIDSILHGPHVSPDAFNLAFPPPAVKKPSPLAPGQGYKYRLYPDKHGASHVWYAPGWPGNPYSSAKRVREVDLEMRYPGEWFDAYLDWAERLEEAMQRRGKGWDGVKGKREPLFVDEGERMLWMVEGLLLACWLSLQGDVGAVEYQPAGEVFVVEKGTLGRVLRRVLGAV